MKDLHLIDTHCHLYDKDFLPEMREVLFRANQAGVRKILMPNIDKTSIDGMLELERDHPGMCLPMMGIHPCYVKEDWREQLEIVRDWLAVHRFSAIGEIGLDFYWDTSFREQQKLVFSAQLAWSIQYGLPVSIHSRNATRECIDLVKSVGNGRIRGVFHCFGGTIDEADEIIRLGMFLGIGGVVTFKKSRLDEVIRHVGLSHIVLETDAPYLAPVPFRGKRNEPSYLIQIATRIAEVMDISIHEVGRITSHNAQDLFA